MLLSSISAIPPWISCFTVTDFVSLAERSATGRGSVACSSEPDIGGSLEISRSGIAATVRAVPPVYGVCLGLFYEDAGAVLFQDEIAVFL